MNNPEAELSGYLKEKSSFPTQRVGSGEPTFLSVTKEGNPTIPYKMEASAPQPSPVYSSL